jgi:hypothetical protein
MKVVQNCAVPRHFACLAWPAYKTSEKTLIGHALYFSKSCRERTAGAFWRDDGSNPLIGRSHAGDSSERADLLMIHLPGIGEQGSMGAMLHWILPRLAAYVAVVVAAGLLVLAGASVYALMWPKPVVPFGQMGR